MLQKRNGSVGEQSLESDKRRLSFADKYFLIQGENQKLRRHIDRLCEALRDWKERALYFRAERDHYKNLAQEENRDL